MMNNLRTLQELSECALFLSFKKSHLESLLRYAKRSRYAPGCRIYQSGSRNEHIHIIRTGTLVKSFPATSSSIPFETLTAGMVWGHENIFSLARTYAYELSTGDQSTDITSIRVYDVIALLQRNPELTKTLMRNVLTLQSQTIAETEQALSLIMKVHAVLRETLHTDTKFERLLAMLTNHFGVGSALLARFDNIANTIVVEKSHNYNPALTGDTYPLASDTVLSLVYSTQNPVIIDGDNFERQYSRVPYFKPLMAIVPLMNTDTLLGALMIGDNDHELHVTPDAIQLLHATGSLVSSTLVKAVDDTSRQQNEYVKRDYIGSSNRLP